MPQLVGVQIGDTIPHRKLLQIPGGALGVHRLRAGFLSKDIGADGFLGLLHPELAQQGKCAISHIHGAKMAVFRGIEIDAFSLGVAEIPSDGDGAGCKVYILPLKGAVLAPANACVDQKVNQGTPFQRLPLQASNDLLHLRGSIG